MVPHKTMHVLSYSMCTAYMHRPYNMPDKVGRYTLAQLSDLKPIMLASPVQAVVACNATMSRVCILVLFIVLCVCLSVCLFVSPHAILAVREITSKTKATIVLSVEFEAIVKWHFS